MPPGFVRGARVIIISDRFAGHPGVVNSNLLQKTIFQAVGGAEWPCGRDLSRWSRGDAGLHLLNVVIREG